ncbi:hypothetical protein [Chitinolyticbacter meiyuanensis]|uniref:hypothetical protein n=1 Tax=Chitinolyticbacter meiyuanensis TaxID=682798 RepID=UPI0011E5CF90|nr:hypothetical protein [Chitinolyticbacter meiyuanensis]
MPNRKPRKFTVNPQGRWQDFCPTMPDGLEPLGTVTGPDGKTSALAIMRRSGTYAQVYFGVIRRLPTVALEAAMPPEMTAALGKPEKGKRRCLILDDKTWAIATTLGGGSPTAGIRVALSIAATQAADQESESTCS